ncbi:MAG: 2-dehydropantoate 2-reductase [Anaerolineales bacterium]|nr:2-dehydropantoate 2-reductase [Anaerolineales bacterium]
MKIVIFGIGAMGCLFGARLSTVCDIQMVGVWPEQRKWLQGNPLSLIDEDGYLTKYQLKVNDRPDLNNDFALILTKSRNTSYVAQFIKNALKPHGIAITLQNGLGNVELLEQQVPDRAMVGVTTMGATLEGAGIVRGGGLGVTYLGTRPDLDDRMQALAEVFNRCGLETQTESDIQALVWGKLAINAAINPLTALLRIPNGVLLQSAWTRQIMAEAARETALVAAEQGIILPFADVLAACETVALKTANNRSSMLQDVFRGVETEIEVICGAVVREGQRLGVPTPNNLMLYNLIKALEISASERIEA